MMKTGKMMLVIGFLCFCAAVHAQSKKNLYPNLAGKWVSKNDPAHTLIVRNGWIYESRARQKNMDSCKYEITEYPCVHTRMPAKRSLYLAEKNGDGATLRCYKLLSYSSNAFAMRSAPGDSVYTFIRYLKRY